MTRDELIARLSGYEWTDFECKRAKREVPKDAYSTVSAFANTSGGWLLFGVSEAGGRLVVSGVDPDAFDKVQDAFLTVLRSVQKLNQPVDAQAHVHELDGKRILAFHIPESPRRQKPVYLNGNPANSYIRRAARDEKVTGSELQRFLRDSSPTPWDSELELDIDPQSSLDFETLNWYREQLYRRHPEKQAIDDLHEFLLEWNLAREHEGATRLARAAILLFGTDRVVRQLLHRPVLDYQRIDTRAEDWSVEERWHDRMVFEENLFKTWRGLTTRFSRIAEHPFSVDPATLRRNDDPPDYIAFREASINLLIHQDYGDLNRKASLKLFTDRTVFWNPGDSLVSRDQMLEAGEHEIRNPLLVGAFRRIGLSDQAGTGIRAIVSNWNQLGRRPPEISNDKAGKSFELTLCKDPLVTDAMRIFQQSIGVRLTPEQADILALATSQKSISITDAAMAIGGNLRTARESLNYLEHQQVLQRQDDHRYALLDRIAALLAQFWTQQAKQGRDQAADQVGTRPGPSQDQVRILEKTQSEQAIGYLMTVLGRSNRTKFRDQVLRPILEAGWLEMTIPDKPTSSKQKYRLTPLGRHILENQE